MIAALVLEWFPENIKVACVLSRPQKWIENNFDRLPIKIEDIFHQRTWSLDFVQRVLLPEHTDMWDHVSTYYSLTVPFCDKNIDWLNFHDLVYNQSLGRNFYIRHKEKIDWLRNPVDKKNLFKQFYS